MGYYILLIPLLIYIFYFPSFHLLRSFSYATTVGFKLPILNILPFSLLVSLLGFTLSINLSKSKIQFHFWDYILLGLIVWQMISLNWCIDLPLAFASISITIGGYILFKSTQILIRGKFFETNFLIKYLFIAFVLIYCVYYIAQFIEVYSLEQNIFNNVNATKGFTGSKNNTGLLLASCMPFLTLMLVNSTKKFIYGLVIFLVMFTVVLAGCRNGLIGIGLFYLIISFLVRPKFRVLLIFLLAIVILLFGLVSLYSALDSYNYFTSAAVSSRLYIWKESLALIKGIDALFGIGAGQWGHFKDLHEHMPFVHPHNDFIRILVEHGVIGLLLFSFVPFIIIYQLVAKFRNHSENQYIEFAILISGVILYLVLMSFDELRLKYNHSAFFWVWLGICASRLPGILRPRYIIKYSILFSCILLLIYCMIVGLQNFKITKAGNNSKIGNYAEAIEDYRMINQTFVNRAGYDPIHCKIGKLQRRQKLKTEELESYESCLKVFPRMKYINVSLHNYYFKNKEYARAFDQLRSLIRSDACNKNFENFLKYYLTQNSFSKEAKEMLAKHKLCSQ